jgi:UDP-N-acetylmuramyl pentapeptide phosphotransferase/UDP-N-acetylglucosamine-1-phosphate transferase
MGSSIMARLGGLLSIAVAVAFGWFFIWEPLQAAQAHAPKVDFSTKAFVLVPFAAVFGVFFVIFGDSVPYRNVEKQVPTAAGWVLVLIAAVVGGIGFWWFNAKFDELGYAMPGQYPSHQQLTPLPNGMPTLSTPDRPGSPGKN